MRQRTTKLSSGDTLRVQLPGGLGEVAISDRWPHCVEISFSGTPGATATVAGPHVNNTAGEVGASIRAEWPQ